MQTFCVLLNFALVFVVLGKEYDPSKGSQLVIKKKPEEGFRCGVCPTYFQKICAFDFTSNATFVFDNLCIMEMYNCLEGTSFQALNYDHCLFFGNFAYVHGFKHEDEDYGEDHVIIKGSAKNPAFVGMDNAMYRRSQTQISR